MMSLQRRQRAGRSHPGAGCVTRPRRVTHGLDGRGAQRAPLAKPGTLPALKAGVPRITLES
jgi:hypothetical protein